MTSNGQGIGLGFVVIGIVLWLLGYANHDRGSGEIQAPDSIRRLVRLRPGRVFLSSIAIEVFGIGLAATGLTVAARIVPPSAILAVGAPATLAVLGLDAFLAYRDRRRG